MEAVYYVIFQYVIEIYVENKIHVTYSYLNLLVDFLMVCSMYFTLL